MITIIGTASNIEVSASVFKLALITSPVDISIINPYNKIDPNTDLIVVMSNTPPRPPSAIAYLEGSKVPFEPPNATLDLMANAFIDEIAPFIDKYPILWIGNIAASAAYRSGYNVRLSLEWSTMYKILDDRIIKHPKLELYKSEDGKRNYAFTDVSVMNLKTIYHVIMLTYQGWDDEDGKGDTGNNPKHPSGPVAAKQLPEEVVQWIDDIKL